MAQDQEHKEHQDGGVEGANNCPGSCPESGKFPLFVCFFLKFKSLS